MGLQNASLDELLGAKRRAIAIVRCDKASVDQPRTRSERAILDVTTIKVGEGDLPRQCQLSRYSQGDPVMAPGKTYLIAAVQAAAVGPTWRLIEGYEVDPGRGEAELLEVVGQMLDRKAVNEGGGGDQ